MLLHLLAQHAVHARLPAFARRPKIGSWAPSRRLYAATEAAASRTDYHLAPMPTKVQELVSRLEADGWFQVRQRGSHRQFHHPSKPGTVTVAGRPGVEIPPGTLNSILKQSGLKK